MPVRGPKEETNKGANKAQEEDGADDGDGIVLNKLALCEDMIKKFSTGGELEGEVVLCARCREGQTLVDTMDT